MLKLKLQYSDARASSLEKYPDAGKERRLEEKGMTEDEIVGWHHKLNGHQDLTVFFAHLILDLQMNLHIR